MLRAFVLFTCVLSWFVVAKAESEPLVGADLSGAETLLATPPGGNESTCCNPACAHATPDCRAAVYRGSGDPTTSRTGAD